MPNLLILTEVQEAMRARYKAMLLERFPQLTINVVGHHSKVDPYIADTDILLCFSPPMADHVVRDAVKLKWIQALGTGVDNIIDLPSLGQEVLVTNIRGIHGIPMSEATIAYMLSLVRDMPRVARAQERSLWERWPAGLLAGKTVGILGVGLISEHLAPMCKAFDMTVIGITATPRAAKGFDRMVTRGELLQVVRELDFLVAMIPMSAETRNIVGEKVLAAMKPTAYLVNMARGGVVDEPALIKALGERPDRRRRARRVYRRSRCRPTARCGRPRTSPSSRIKAAIRKATKTAPCRPSTATCANSSPAISNHDQYRAQARLLGRLNHGFVRTPEHADLHRRARAPLEGGARRHGRARRSTCC